MPIDVLTLLGALGVVSGLLGVGRALLLTMTSINEAAFESVLLRLLGAGELERTRRLLRAAPKALYPKMLLAGVAVLDTLPKNHPEPLARAEMVEAMQRERDATLAQHRYAPLVDLVQLALALGALGLSWKNGVLLPPWGYVGAGLGVLSFIHLLRRRRSLAAITPQRAGEIIDATLGAWRKPGNAAGPYRVPTPSSDVAADPGELSVRVWRGETSLGAQALPAGDVLKIGRLASTKGCLTLDDPSVARVHAVLDHSSDDTELIDLGSSEGVRVNGQRVNKATVRPGDNIEIGPFRLELVSALQVKAEPKSGGTPVRRRCSGCGSETLVALDPMPDEWATSQVQAEHCQSCGKIELFKSVGARE